jgi:PASTA domain
MGRRATYVATAAAVVAACLLVFLTLDGPAADTDDDDNSPGSETTQAPIELNLFGGDDPEDRRMPDVVCMDLQEAQNEIQDHGVFLSGSTDASGEGRRQIIDANWIVVEQKPAAGSPIGEADAELFVVKDDEPNPC